MSIITFLKINCALDVFENSPQFPFEKWVKG